MLLHVVNMTPSALIPTTDGNDAERALWLAAYRGDEREVARLIGLVRNLNYQDDDNGQTALSEAVTRGHLPVVKLLLAAGADPRIRNDYSCSAFDYAVLQRDIKLATDLVTELLSKDKGLVNLSNEYGQTALASCARSCQTDKIALLLSAGADPNIANVEGKTALHLAMDHDAMSGEAADIVTARNITLLLTGGANPRLKNMDGDTALDIAKKGLCPKNMPGDTALDILLVGKPGRAWARKTIAIIWHGHPDAHTLYGQLVQLAYIDYLQNLNKKEYCRTCILRRMLAHRNFRVVKRVENMFPPEELAQITAQLGLPLPLSTLVIIDHEPAHDDDVVVEQ